ncbi:MAG: hypothetical protein ACTSO6_01160 [Promethearchaeota archaeon]
MIGEFADSGQKITIYDHFTGTSKVIFSEKLSFDYFGHGGGDFSLLDSFLEALTNPKKSQPLTNADETIESHLMAFAANKAREKNSIIEMDEFRMKIGKSENANF